MPWAVLFVAGLLEIGWAIGLKYSDGFSKLWPSVATIVAMIASFTCLSWAIRTIPVGTGYAIWTGIGAAGTAMLGIVLFAEPLTTARMICLLFVVAGTLGLKFTG